LIFYYQRSKGAWAIADNKQLNEQQRNEQAIECKANERPSACTARPNNQIVERAGRRSPPQKKKQIKGSLNNN